VRAKARRAAQRGFTLVELMVALVVSSLLVGMILAIFMRMSVAYRGQQQVAEVQGKLAAARAMIEHDARHAGLAMAQGFKISSTPVNEFMRPLNITNSSSGPDRIRFFYADTSKRAYTVTSGSGICDPMQCDRLDSTADFAPGDVVLMSTATLTPSPYAGDGDAQITTFKACVLQVGSKGPTQLVFEQSGLWGSPGNGHCTNPVLGETIFYGFVAHAWRIDPTRRALGVLQLSKTGDLVGGSDWEDQAYGFTDIQVATRFYEDVDPAPSDGRQLTDTADPDQDPVRDWYSDSEQETLLSQSYPTFIVPIQLSITLVARTERDVEGVASSSTPNLTVAGNAGNNTIGDRAAVPLPSVTTALSGNRIFRHTTFQVDLRNVGVGR
jgi:prepilin-type N-terminal cleavage/methylation domain-containing protein